MESSCHTIMRNFSKMYDIPCHVVDIDLSTHCQSGDFYTDVELGRALGRVLHINRSRIGTEAGGRTNFFKNNKEFWHWEITTSTHDSQNQAIYIVTFWFKNKEDAVYFKMVSP